MLPCVIPCFFSIRAGLPGDPGGLGFELQQPGGHPLGDHRHARQRQHPQPGPQPHRERP